MPGLAAVLDAVGVGVVPHEVADRHRLVEAEVDRQVAAALGQQSSCWARVAVRRRRALARRRRHITGQRPARGKVRRIHAHRVRARRLGEAVLPPCPSSCHCVTATPGRVGPGQREAHVG